MIGENGLRTIRLANEWNLVLKRRSGLSEDTRKCILVTTLSFVQLFVILLGLFVTAKIDTVSRQVPFLGLTTSLLINGLIRKFTHRYPSIALVRIPKRPMGGGSAVFGTRALAFYFFNVIWASLSYVFSL